MIFDYKGITNKNKDLIFIAGPCVIESEEMTINIAKKLKEIKERLNIQLIFKGSYDKANRTSLNSFRGLGMKNGLEILKTVSKEFNLPTITDIHIPAEAEENHTFTKKMCGCWNYDRHWRMFEDESRAGCFI